VLCPRARVQLVLLASALHSRQLAASLQTSPLYHAVEGIEKLCTATALTALAAARQCENRRLVLLWVPARTPGPRVWGEPALLGPMLAHARHFDPRPNRWKAMRAVRVLGFANHSRGCDMPAPLVSPELALSHVKIIDAFPRTPEDRRDVFGRQSTRYCVCASTRRTAQAYLREKAASPITWCTDEVMLACGDPVFSSAQPGAISLVSGLKPYDGCLYRLPRVPLWSSRGYFYQLHSHGLPYYPSRGYAVDHYTTQAAERLTLLSCEPTDPPVTLVLAMDGDNGAAWTPRDMAAVLAEHPLAVVAHVLDRDRWARRVPERAGQIARLSWEDYISAELRALAAVHAV
jgi:hypothetical protein